MNLIRNILLIILFLQLLFFLYIRFFSNINPMLENQESIASIELPQSSEYTIWDDEKIAQLNEEIKTFNASIKPIQKELIPSYQSTVIIKELNTTKLTKSLSSISKKVNKKINKKISIRKKIKQYAKEKLGKKYVWGATGPKTFDCSGFTQEVFHSTIGIKIPRVSRDQSKVGTYIEYKALELGDMVFFDTEKKFTKKVNHVGIYLGNNNFIHASSAKKKVIITNFKKKPFYKKRFLWGRRVIKSSL